MDDLLTDFVIQQIDLSREKVILLGSQHSKTKLLASQTPLKVIKFGNEAIHEYEIVQTLIHPNILKYYGVVFDPQYGTGLQMEFCQRGTLENIIFDSRIIYTINTAIYWAEQLFQALIYLKEKEIVHRDIKPANIFVTEDFSLKIGNFQYSMGVQWEVNEDLAVTYSTDIYSMGIVFWEIIERRYAFRSENKIYNDYSHFADFQKEQTAGLHFSYSGCKEFKETILECAAFDPRERPNAEEVLEKIIIIKNDKEIQQYEFMPIIDNDRTRIMRPDNVLPNSFTPREESEVETFPSLNSEANHDLITSSQVDDMQPSTLMFSDEEERSLIQKPTSLFQPLYTINQSGEGTFNKQLFNRIMDQVGNCKIAIISIAGLPRGGKTFWLNFLLRALRKGDAHFKPDEIIGGPSGASFQSGLYSHTTGIQICTETFFINNNESERIAVLLLDTGGLFDLFIKWEHYLRCFSILVLLSSTLVYNCFKFLTSSDLEIFLGIRPYIGYDEKFLIQHLILLSRDTPGRIGFDKDYVEMIKTSQLKDFFGQFDKFDAVFVPHPRAKLRTANFQIFARDIGSNFLNTLADLAENILTKIHPKAIDDIFFTGVSYRSYVEQVIKQMERKEKSNITSLFEATNELAFNELRMDALKEFERLWNQQNEINAYSPIDPELFEETGKTILETVTQTFAITLKYGGEEKRQRFGQFIQQLRELNVERAQMNFLRFRDLRISEAYDRAMQLYQRGVQRKIVSGVDPATPEELQNVHNNAVHGAIEFFENEASSFPNCSTIFEEKKRKLVASFKNSLTNTLREVSIQAIKDVFYDLCETMLRNYREELAQLRLRLIDSDAFQIETLLNQENEKFADYKMRETFLTVQNLSQRFSIIPVVDLKKFAENVLQTVLDPMIKACSEDFLKSIHFDQEIISIQTSGFQQADIRAKLTQLLVEVQNSRETTRETFKLSLERTKEMALLKDKVRKTFEKQVLAKEAREHDIHQKGYRKFVESLSIGIHLRNMQARVAVFVGDEAICIPAGNGQNVFSVPSEQSVFLDSFLGSSESSTSMIFAQHRQLTRAGVLFEMEEMSPRTKALTRLFHGLNQSCEEFLGRPIHECAFAIPSYLCDLEKLEIRKAAKSAGLRVCYGLSEPVAAALASGIKNSSNKSKYIMVYHLRGDGVIVSILEIKQDHFKVLSTSKSSTGSQALEIELAVYLMRKIKKDFNETLTFERARRRLLLACEQAKIDLTQHETALINIPSLKLFDFKITIKRKKFEWICRDVFKEMIAPIDVALKMTNLKAKQIDDLLVLGHSTQIQRIQELLKSKVKCEHKSAVNSDEMVVEGAAIQAAKLGGYISKRLTQLSFRDATALSLGVRFRGNLMKVVIPKDSPIPISKQITCTTTYDGQSSMEIQIYEGERAMASANRLLGTLQYKIRRGEKGFVHATVSFNVHRRGELEVFIEDPLTNDSNFLSLRQLRDGFYEADEVKRVIQEANNHAKEDQEFIKKNIILSELDDLAFQMANNLKREFSKLGEPWLTLISNRGYEEMGWIHEHSATKSRSVLEVRLDALKRFCAIAKRRKTRWP